MAKVIGIMLLLLFSFPVYGQKQQKSESIKIHFALNGSAVDLDFGSNSAELKRLSDLVKMADIDPNVSILKINIDSYASPEGGRIYNEQLTQKRTDAIGDYLKSALSVSDSLIERSYSGIDWEGLRDLVEESDMEYRSEVIDIIENTPEETWQRVKPNDKWLTLVDSRLKQLQDLSYGNPYRYMATEFYPLLRVGSVVTIHFKSTLQPIIEEAETLYSIKPMAMESIPSQSYIASEVDDKKSIRFALKSNLLYDLLLTPNVELEVPIGKRWSVVGEWIFPWWVFDNGAESSFRSRLQLLNGNIEGKYWFGERDRYDALTGWYCGLYSGAGLYDVEYKAKGYQGEFFVAAGLSGGYAHTINRSGSLRMEYSLSVGYLKTNYNSYNAMWGDDDLWHPVKAQEGTYSWFGPTKARLSLVWMIGQKSKRGGRYE